MKSRSPRVVAIGRKPLRSCVGERISQIVMPASNRPTATKKTAVGSVQTIQSNMFVSPRASDAAHGKTLGDVMAHKPDHHGARNDGERSRRRERRPVHA